MRLRLLSIGYGVLIALSLLFLVLRVLEVTIEPRDFCQDYISAHYFLAGQPVYGPIHCLTGQFYIPSAVEYSAHPPFSILFFLPISLLPYVLAQLLWAALSLVAYLVAGWLLLREVGWLSLRSVAAFLLLSLIWQPVGMAIEAQNLMQVLLLLLVAAWILERRGHPRWAGVLIGIAALLKVWPAFMILGALVLRRWQAALTGAVTFIAGIVISLMIVGSDAYAAYLGPVQAYEWHWTPNPGVISLESALIRPLVQYYALQPVISGLSFDGAVLLGEAVTGCVAAVVLFLLWRWYRPDKEETWQLSQGILLTVTILAFPLTWHWGLVALLLVAANVVLALRALPRPPRWWYALVALSVLPLTQINWLILAASVMSTRRAQVLLDLPAAGLLLLLGAQLYLLQRARKAEPLVTKEPETPALVSSASGFAS